MIKCLACVSCSSLCLLSHPHPSCENISLAPSPTLNCATRHRSFYSAVNWRGAHFFVAQRCLGLHIYVAYAWFLDTFQCRWCYSGLNLTCNCQILAGSQTALNCRYVCAAEKLMMIPCPGDVLRFWVSSGGADQLCLLQARKPVSCSSGDGSIWGV